jgi:hypothetical protein
VPGRSEFDILLDRGEGMPLAEQLAAKTKEVQAHEALCQANSGLRIRLENELAPIQKELAKQEGFLTLCQTQLKASTAAVPKLKTALAAAKPADKAKADAAFKAEEKKLKSLKEQEPKLKKLIAELEAEVKTNSAAWNKVAADVKVLAARKTALAAELVALQAKRAQADVIEAYTFATILGNAALLKDFGDRTHNEEIVAFIANGPRGNKATYTKFVQNDDINLEGAKAVRNAFRELAKQEAAGTAVDWTKAPWQDAYNYVIRDLQSDTRHLDEYKKLLRAAKGLT